MKIFLFIMLFFLASALIIISNNELAFYKTENIQTFSTLYVYWLDNIYSNVQIITANAIGLDWFPKENQNP